MYHMKIILRNFNAKVRKIIFSNRQVGNENLHQDSNDNGEREGMFATSKSLVAKSTTFLHRTFISTPRRLLMGRLTTRLITY